MKKIWILHNSKYGNSETIAKQLAEGLRDSYEVSVDHIKKVSLEDIAKSEPYGMIFAVRILATMSDKNIRKFINNLNKMLTKPISKVAYFSTHGMGWKESFLKGMKKTLDKVGCFEEICPEYLEVLIEGNKGPAAEGSDLKIKNYILKLKEFMK